MNFFDKFKKSNKGGYIFLSHSHDDIDKVRKIRNHLEKDGFEPLCFYLKCLEDDSEIEDLIKREIDAREWFVFINSIEKHPIRITSLALIQFIFTLLGILYSLSLFSISA